MGDSSEKWRRAGRLSIGQLSRLTGVHIKSLRYYGRLGILRPAFIDPMTGYRYYDFSQLRLVEAIALCVDLGLPLKRFAAYLKGSESIRYGQIIQDGLALIAARQQELRTHERMLKAILDDARHGERCASAKTCQTLRLPTSVCRVMPCETDGPDAAFDRLIAGIARDGLKVGYESGAMALLCGSERHNFVYATLRGPFPATGTPEAQGLIRFPSAEWRCVVPQGAPLLEPQTSLPKAFRKSYDRLIVERELFTPDYAIAPERLEWLCSLPGYLSQSLKRRLLALRA